MAPLAVMNFMGTLQCVESAAAPGSLKVHVQEQEAIIEETLEPS